MKTHRNLTIADSHFLSCLTETSQQFQELLYGQYLTLHNLLP